MTQQFAIMNVCGSRIIYIGENGAMTTEMDRAAKYVDFEEARTALEQYMRSNMISLAERDTFSIIPVLMTPDTKTIPELRSLPPPDFYEVGEATSAAFIIDILSSNDFALGFTPVDNITGAGQMTSGIGTDHHTDRAVARMSKFSFPGWMEISEVAKLQESATRHGQWRNCRITNRGNGFAKWFIVTLSSELR